MFLINQIARMDKLKTTIVVATYKGDPWLDHIKNYLQAMRGYNKTFKVLLVDPKHKNTFAQNNNKGAKDADTPYVLFLNIAHLNKSLRKYLYLLSISLIKALYSGPS